jgi:hypothetical protein
MKLVELKRELHCLALQHKVPLEIGVVERAFSDTGVEPLYLHISLPRKSGCKVHPIPGGESFGINIPDDDGDDVAFSDANDIFVYILVLMFYQESPV